MIFPKSIHPGSSIAIISPATVVKPEYIRQAAEFIDRHGYKAVIAPHACGPQCGSYASSLNDRLNDWLGALQDPSIDAILCARGGYGCVQLAANTPLELVRLNPKWIVGFSDVSALHALFFSAGVASIHGPMAKHIATERPDDPCTRMLFRILAEGLPVEISAAPHPFNVAGAAQGRLVGGNFAVLSDLAATPFDLLSAPLNEDCILFIEDISEPLYALDRMLWRLYLSGALSRAKGLIIGRFTEYKPDANFESAEELISSRLKMWRLDHIPAAYSFPTGHVSENYPLVEGSMCRLEIAEKGVTLKLSES